MRAIDAAAWSIDSVSMRQVVEADAESCSPPRICSTLK